MDTLKILVVDDESRMRKLVKDFLTKKNFQVLEAGDGEEAMDIFYKEKDIALIILDVMMPKMDGWEVCREVRKNSKVPIIMLTARGDERDELLGFDLGVDEYISKPFSPKILVARVEAIKQGGEIIGNHTKVKVVKNKVAPPFKEAEFDIMFGQGISREGDLIDLAVKVDAVQKSGAWYAYKGEKIGQGRENAKTFLREHPEIMAEVEVQVREYYNLPTDTVVESAPQEEGQPKAGDNQNGQFDSITTEE